MPTTERITEPLGFSGNPLFARRQLIDRLENLIKVNKRIQPDLERETILQVVDEYLVDYALAGHKRDEGIEQAVNFARNNA